MKKGENLKSLSLVSWIKICRRTSWFLLLSCQIVFSLKYHHRPLFTLVSNCLLPQVPSSTSTLSSTLKTLPTFLSRLLFSPSSLYFLITFTYLSFLSSNKRAPKLNQRRKIYIYTLLLMFVFKPNSLIFLCFNFSPINMINVTDIYLFSHFYH